VSVFEPLSRGLAIIVLQQSAKFFVAGDFPGWERNRLRFFPSGFRNRSIVERLMRPMPVVKGLEPFADVPQMFDAETDKMIEALATDRLNLLTERLTKPNSDNSIPM
jgi:hypothetical protein